MLINPQASSYSAFYPSNVTSRVQSTFKFNDINDQLIQSTDTLVLKISYDGITASTINQSDYVEIPSYVSFRGKINESDTGDDFSELDKSDLKYFMNQVKKLVRRIEFKDQSTEDVSMTESSLNQPFNILDLVNDEIQSENQVLCGEDALKLLGNDQFITRNIFIDAVQDKSSVQLFENCFELLLKQLLSQILQQSMRTQYTNVILIVPDIVNQKMLTSILNVLFQDLYSFKFLGVQIVQQSVVSALGFAAGQATVVELGEHQFSVSCVDGCMTVPNSSNELILTENYLFDQLLKLTLTSGNDEVSIDEISIWQMHQLGQLFYNQDFRPNKDENFFVQVKKEQTFSQSLNLSQNERFMLSLSRFCCFGELVSEQIQSDEAGIQKYAYQCSLLRTNLRTHDLLSAEESESKVTENRLLKRPIIIESQTNEGNEQSEDYMDSPDKKLQQQVQDNTETQNKIQNSNDDCVNDNYQQMSLQKMICLSIFANCKPLIKIIFPQETDDQEIAINEDEAKLILTFFQNIIVIMPTYLEQDLTSNVIELIIRDELDQTFKPYLETQISIGDDQKVNFYDLILKNIKVQIKKSEKPSSQLQWKGAIMLSKSQLFQDFFYLSRNKYQKFGSFALLEQYLHLFNK